MWRSWAGMVTQSSVLRPVGSTVKFSKTTEAYGIEINIQLSGNSSDGHSYSQHPNCMLPQNTRHPWRCVTEVHIRVAFYCPQHKVYLCNDHTV
jgi:hypothetical protein